LITVAWSVVRILTLMPILPSMLWMISQRANPDGSAVVCRVISALPPSAT
jgi:hypothetical protein